MKRAISSLLLGATLLMTVSPAFAGDRWTSPFGISGGGVRDCGESRATSEAWNACRTKARTAEEATGIPVSVIDIEVTGFDRDDEEGPPWDRWHKCSFSATVRCNFRT